MPSTPMSRNCSASKTKGRGGMLLRRKRGKSSRNRTGPLSSHKPHDQASNPNRDSELTPAFRNVREPRVAVALCQASPVRAYHQGHVGEGRRLQAKAWYSCNCRGVEGTRSSPRTTSVTPLAASSTTAAS